jgi:hypothetical protein
VKFLLRIGRAHQRFYQFTAIDEATRFRILRVYDDNKIKTLIDFLSEVREHFPFAIQKIPTETESSLGTRFTWHLSGLSISHRHIPPGWWSANGKVERSHKTELKSSRGRYFRHKKIWFETEEIGSTVYENRAHLALKRWSPAERLRELIQPSKPIRDLLY